MAGVEMTPGYGGNLGQFLDDRAYKRRDPSDLWRIIQQGLDRSMWGMVHSTPEYRPPDPSLPGMQAGTLWGQDREPADTTSLWTNQDMRASWDPAEKKYRDLYQFNPGRELTSGEVNRNQWGDRIYDPAAINEEYMRRAMMSPGAYRSRNSEFQDLSPGMRLAIWGMYDGKTPEHWGGMPEDPMQRARNERRQTIDYGNGFA